MANVLPETEVRGSSNCKVQIFSEVEGELVRWCIVLVNNETVTMGSTPDGMNCANDSPGSWNIADKPV